MTAFKSLSVAMAKGFFRDKATLFFTFVFPLMFLVVFGLIFRDAGSEKIEIAVVGNGTVIENLERNPAVDPQRFDDLDAAVQKVRDGDLPAVVAEQGDQVTVRFAASDQAMAGVVNGLVGSVVAGANQQATGQPPRYTIEAEQVEDESLDAIQFLTPGIMSWGIAVTAVFGSALTLVSWRRKQVLRRLRLAPVGVPPLLTARVSVTIAIAVVQALIFVGVGLLPVFGLQLTGTWWLSIPVFLCGVLAFFSIGMLVGAFAKTEEAATAAANIVVLPMAFLSGTFFPIDQTPDWVQTVSKVLPLRHMNDGVMDFMVRGRPISAMWVPCLILLAFAVVIGFIAARVFRWEDN
ncbi:MAG TPA: ABC transporter permease [Actinophytocola sp.]|uniref:ABC transporter permease n=1 Tax=Actinophytocola sp. TaxID=1872138 RepID=UPI002DBB89D9|nr:ABC transporter permease [Actinophytocola sp.]HEU5470074.1 ABC transporter permease [Actinophytocola sp.]